MASLSAGAPDALASHVPLRWTACGETGAVERATVRVPRDDRTRCGANDGGPRKRRSPHVAPETSLCSSTAGVHS